MFIDDDSLQKQLLEEWSQTVEEEDESPSEIEGIPDDDELANNDYYDDEMDFLELLPLETSKIKGLVSGKKTANGRKSVSKTPKRVSRGEDEAESDGGYFDEDEMGGKSGDFEDDGDEMYYGEEDEMMSNVEEDLIEVYDEDGELVGVYDVEEFQKIKAGGVPV